MFLLHTYVYICIYSYTATRLHLNSQPVILNVGGRLALHACKICPAECIQIFMYICKNMYIYISKNKFMHMYTSTYICIHIHTYVRRCVAANAHSKPLLLPSSTFPINQGCTSQTIPTARPTWLAIACCHPRSTERAHVI